MKKRLLSLLLTLAMVLTLAPVAFAAGDDNTAQDADSTEAADTVQTAITTSEELKTAIASAKDGDTITLGAGTFTTYGNTSPKKSLTFVGAGKGTVWTIGDLTTVGTDESNGDYSFDGCNTITFKDMTLKSDNANYRGFIRINNTVVDNCVLEGRTAYWGYKTASFTDCTFNALNGDYALWVYGNNKGSATMTLTNCTFNGTGKFVHVYREAAYPVSVTFEDCKFVNTGAAANKSAINIKETCGTTILDNSVVINNCTTEGAFPTDKNGNSKLFMVDDLAKSNAKTTVTVNGELVWKDGAAVSTVKVAKVGDQQYTSLQAAIDAADDNATVKLLADVDIAQTVVVSGKTITLNMDGKTIANTKDIWDVAPNGWSMISVREGGNLTITGDGKVLAKKDDSYAVDVQDANAKLTIKNGTFVGNIHAIYVESGTADIEGGTYSVQQKFSETQPDEFVLNLYDANRQNGTAKLTVSGGTFEKFNPADCQAEGAGTNFCAEGYTTTSNGDTYTVVTGENAAVANAGANYNTLENAISAAANGGTVKMLKDVDLTKTVAVSGKTITLDMNGKKLYNTKDLWDTTVNNWSLISVRKNGDLTITGEGTFQTKENDCYALDTQEETAKLTIENGTFVGNISVVYVHPGELNIKGGHYSIQQLNENNVQDGYGLTINCNDADYKEGKAKVSISGGSFAHFNPSNNAAEGAGTNFCASGYVAVKGGTEEEPVWKVEDHRVAEINGVGYTSLQDAVNAAENGDTVKMLTDVIFDENSLKIDTEKSGLVPQITIEDKKITLDMAKHKIGCADSVTKSDFGKCSPVFLVIGNNADVTITGNGTIDCEAGNNQVYGINVNKGGNLRIENGTYRGALTAVQVQEGALAIAGGSFEMAPTCKAQVPHFAKYVINAIDTAWKNGSATIAITGGTFCFDVSNNPEGEGTTYCAPGYKTELTNGVYVVKAGTNDAMTAIDKALESGKAEDVKAAVDAVVEIPNETLADNSTIMDKLAQLEEKVTSNNSSIKVVVNSTVDEHKNVTAKNAALSASTTATDDQTITIHVKDSDASTTAAKTAAKGTGEAKALDISMTHQIGNGTAEPIQPKAPVVLTFALPTGWDNAEIVRVDEEKNTTEIVPSTVSNGTISGVFNHFSTYVLVQTDAEENPNKYEVILTPDKTDVSAGDTITYTVTLKHTAGDNANLGYILITPVIKNTELLSLESGAGNTTNGITFSDRNGAPEFSAQNSGKGKELRLNESMEIGTLTYKVKAYPTDNTPVEVTISDADQVSSSAYRETTKPTVTTEKDVTYHMITVTFKQDDTTKDKVYYAKYDNKGGLYATLDDMVAGNTTAVDKPKDNSTKYRLKDDKWHLESDTTQVYVENTTTFKTSATYVTERVELVKVTPPEELPITVIETDDEHPVTKRNDDTYVDKSADLKFKIDKEPNAGEKYEVTVTVNGNTVTPEQDADGNYTVKGKDVTGDVEITVKSVLDLSADDIGIFTEGKEGEETYAYLQYSTYSKTDTLVLIKGKTGANYTLGADQPTIYATTAYDGYTHAVLVPKPTGEVSAKAMLEYLKETCGLATSKTKNTVLEDSWDTNGNGNVKRDLGDVQAANDFKTLEDLKWTPSDDLLLLANVVTLRAGADKYDDTAYDVARDGYVSDADVSAFVYRYAKLG